MDPESTPFEPLSHGKETQARLGDSANSRSDMDSMLTATPTTNMAVGPERMPSYSWKYSIPLRMLNSVQQICRDGTMMSAGNILKPCTCGHHTLEVSNYMLAYRPSCRIFVADWNCAWAPPKPVCYFLGR